jgi:hypothetical protein
MATPIISADFPFITTLSHLFQDEDRSNNKDALHAQRPWPAVLSARRMDRSAGQQSGDGFVKLM